MAINTTAGCWTRSFWPSSGGRETGTYGYKITQEVRAVLELSESTLYPVLRRLQKDGCLAVHDEAFNGRNRRYYQITPAGPLHGWRNLPPSGKPTPPKSTSSLRGEPQMKKIRVLYPNWKTAVCPAS